MIKQIKPHREELRHYVSLFMCGGSICSARSRAAISTQAHSDIDFLVEFDRSAPQHPFDAYFGLKEALGELFGRPVYLVAARNPHLKASIDGSRGSVFEAWWPRPGGERAIKLDTTSLGNAVRRLREGPRPLRARAGG
jgi:predicted nucleotidyltransferase